MKNNDLEKSSKDSYHSIWLGFLKFLDGFDDLPDNWEDKLVMYVAHLGNEFTAPATISSYVSAIRYKLRKDGVKISEKSLEIASIIRTCKKLNKRVILREPIHKHMLHFILDALEVELTKRGQPFLLKLYRAIFTMGYYGFMRIGEVVDSQHAVVIRDIKAALNKDTVNVILWSSKTQKAGTRPHEIRIPQVIDLKPEFERHSPFKIITEYKKLRPETNNNVQFFVFSDGSLVRQHHVRNMLKTALRVAGLDQDVHDFHSLRAGRCSDLLNAGVPLIVVKKWGRWKDDNTVMKYFKK